MFLTIGYILKIKVSLILLLNAAMTTAMALRVINFQPESIHCSHCTCVYFSLIRNSTQWWIFKIGGLRQNSDKGPRKIDVAINNCDQTTLPSTTL